MYVYATRRRMARLGDDSIFSMIGRVVAMPFESVLAPGSQFLTLPTPAPPAPPTPGPPSPGILQTISNTVQNALPTWAGGTSGKLTTNQVANQIATCKAGVIKASRGLSPAQIQSGLDHCTSDIAAIASMPSLYNPSVAGSTDLTKLLVIGGLVLGGIFILSR